jgi:hypothetical protein
MTTFTDVTAVKALAPFEFAADISPRWTIAGHPNGGYLLATIGRAVAELSVHPHVFAASAHFLRSPEPGPAQIQVEPLRTGRTTSQLRGRLLVDGKPCVEALFTMGTIAPTPGPAWQDGLPDPAMTDPAAAIRLAPVTPGGHPAAMMAEAEVRLDPDYHRRFTESPSGRGEIRGWLALPDGATFDPVSLLYAVDAFPAATFDIAVTDWVPTVELTAYVRALPAAGPLRVVNKARLVDGPWVDQACHVWDSTGRLVAQASQLAGVRLP